MPKTYLSVRDLESSNLRLEDLSVRRARVERPLGNIRKGYLETRKNLAKRFDDVCTSYGT